MARLEEQCVGGPGEGRTLFVPPMDPFAAQVMTAVFRSVGYDAVLLEENDETLALGLKHTGGGECVPCPTTVGSLIKAMQEREIPPENVIFFMPTACGPCRLGQYAKLDTMIFEKMGWEGIRLMSPSAENAYAGLDNGARMRLWHALVVGDVMRKLACKIRPYEVNKGDTDRIITEYMTRLEKAFEQLDIDPVSDILAEAVKKVQAIAVRKEQRPLIGIVGEIYVRSNTFMNNDLIRCIESLGGEAALAPFAEWILYTNYLTGLIDKETKAGPKLWLSKIKNWFETNLFFEKWEHYYYEIAKPVLHDRMEYPIADVMEIGSRYLPWQFEGEAALTLGRAVLFVERDGAKAVINASPMFCMPGTITSSIFPKLEEDLGVPMVCNFYDGSGDPNKSLVPVMHYLCEEMAVSAKS